MDNNQIKVCRLCLNITSFEKYDPIEGSIKMMLDLITPNLKLETTNNPLMCKECSTRLQEAFDFKTNFFEVEEVIDLKKEDSSISSATLSELMCGNKKRKSTVVTNYCRTCLVKIESKLFIDIKRDLGRQHEALILKNCLLEMDISLTSDCKICLPCFDQLQKMNKFKVTCLENEKNINQFLTENPLKSGSKLNLNDIVYQLTTEKNIKLAGNKRNPKVKPMRKKKRLEKIEQDDSSSVPIKKEDAGRLNQRENITNERTDEEPPEISFGGRSVFKCTERGCKFITPHKNNIVRHLKGVHGKKARVFKRVFGCTECNFSTMDSTESVKHLLSHANNDNFKCTKCSYTHNHKSELIKHIFSHVDGQSLEEYRTLHQKILNM